MNKHGKIIAIFVLILFSSSVWAISNPTTMLQQVSNNVLSQLKAKKTTLKSNPDAVYRIIRHTLLPHVDTDMMSKKALTACGWGKGLSAAATKRCEQRGIKPATEVQRKQFVKLFETLLIYTYSSALAEYADVSIKFYPIRGGYQGKKLVDVNSDITPPSGPAVPVVYHMVAHSDKWLAYDMSVDGISIVESFRSQFVNELRHGGMNALLNLLNRHNKRVEAANRRG